MEHIFLLPFFFLLPTICGHPSNSYYLIDLDQHLPSNESYCSDILTKDQTYRIPKQCHHHLLCDPYYCDDKSFRCIKIRETLCCLYDYFQSSCQLNSSIQIKDLFRSVYFQMSIEHGYCEINLERIEKADQAYCIANIEETMTTTTTTTTASPSTIAQLTSRSSFKYFHRRPLPSVRPHRFRQRIATRQNYSSLVNLDYVRQFTIIEESIPSKHARNDIHRLLMMMAFFLSTLI